MTLFILKSSFPPFIAVLLFVFSVQSVAYSRSHDDWVAVMQEVVRLSIASSDSTTDTDQHTDDKSKPPFQLGLNETIPSPESFLGYPIGSNHLRHHELVGYMQRLCSLSPRFRWIGYGETFEGRKLGTIVVANPKRQADHRASIEARERWLVSDPDSVQLDVSIPSVCYLTYSVHGDEASPANAAMLVLYLLAAAEGEWIDRLLEQTVILIDPCLNPDGIDRYANWVRANRGNFPSSDPSDREHHEPFPSSRTNHFGFDLNRDWLPATQPETQGRLNLYYDWLPNLVLDFHEMSASQSLFFQPGIEGRDHPVIPPFVRETTQRIAKGFATVLDEAGERYFTRQRFDDFYPGKGSTFPDLHGAVGILVEQGTSAGMQYQQDGATRSFDATIANPLRLSLASIFAIEREHRSLMEYQRDFYGKSRAGFPVDENPNNKFATTSDQQPEPTNGPSPSYYLIGVPRDPKIARQWLKTLEIHNIKSYRLAEDFTDNESTWKADSTWVIPSQQSESRFLHAMMERRKTFAFSEFYDVSSWNLGDAFGLDWSQVAHDVKIGESVDSESIASTFKPLELSRETFPAIAVECSSIDSMPLLRAISEAGLPVRMNASPLTVEGLDGTAITLGSQSLFLLRSDAIQDWTSSLNSFCDLCNEYKIQAVPLRSLLASSGTDLGSSDLRPYKIPKLGLLLDASTRATSAGSFWYVLDQVFQWPVTRIETDQVSEASLRSIDVLIVPDSNQLAFANEVEKTIDTWLQSGGHLIAVGKSIVKAERISRFESQRILSLEEIDLPPLRLAIESVPGVILQGNFRLEPPSQSIDLRFHDENQVKFLQSGEFYAIPNLSIAEILFKAASATTIESNNEKASLWKPLLTLDDRSWLAGFLRPEEQSQLYGQVVATERPIQIGKITLMTFDPTFRGHYWSTITFLKSILMAP